MPPQERFDLVEHSLKPKTRREYRTALLEFIDYCEKRSLEIRKPSQFDHVLCQYIHAEFRSPGRDGRGHVNKVMSALLFYLPEIKGSLHLSHKAIIGWSRLRPSQQMTPCPHDLALGIAYFLRLRGNHRMCLAVLLMFDCHLRHEELRSISKRKVIITEDEEARIVLLLAETKTGKNQSVQVRMRLVKTMLLRELEDVQDLDDKLFPFSQDFFRQNIHEIMDQHFPLTDPKSKITPHSFRHGGATRDYMLKRLSLQEIKDRGRWKNDSTLYNYVQVAKSLIVQVTLPEQARMLLKDLNSDIDLYFNVQGFQSGWEEFVTEP